MDGARDYYDLFEGRSQQQGRLFLKMHTHARGKCFEILILKEGVIALTDRIGQEDTVTVYGVTGGQRGWTETYGWLHEGKWQEDFAKLVAGKKAENLAICNTLAEKRRVTQLRAQDAVQNLLNTYK